jgi:hypothetical protein
MFGDRRPLALPARVCNVYDWAKEYKRADIPMRECVACGYDVPAPPTPVVNYGAMLKIVADLSRPIESRLSGGITSCPLCGGALAPEGDRPWSDKNPDDVVDVYVWPDGEVSLLG